MGQSFRVSDLKSMPKIKEAAYKSPVMITERGCVEFVLMTVSDFNELNRAASRFEKIMSSDEQRLRMAVANLDGKWPKQLVGSGVMFYDGLRITIEEFRSLAIKLGYEFCIK